MRKIKKVIIGFWIFLIELTTRVFGKANIIYQFETQSLYAAEPVRKIAPFVLGNIILSCISFIVGLVVIFNKKIATKVKIIIVSIMLILILIAIIAIMLEI